MREDENNRGEKEERERERREREGDRTIPAQSDFK